MSTGTEWIKVDDAADLVSRDPRTIRRWIHDGALERLRVGRSVYVRADQVLKTESSMEQKLDKPSFGREKK